MTDTSTAGWYPDPEGRPGLERWWNGLGWSDAVRSGSAAATLTAPRGGAAPNDLGYGNAAGTGTSHPADPESRWLLAHPPAVPPAAPPGTPPAEPPNTEPPRRVSGAALGWTAGVVALAVILALVVFTGGRSSDPDPPIATGAAPEIPTRPPGTTRIIDDAAGVAYPYLGAYWLEFVNEVAETTSTAGQYIVTQEQTPDGGQFIAQVTSGPLQPVFGSTGPSSFPAVIAAVQDSVRAGYYPAPNTIETLRDEPITIDGAAAYLLEFNLKWDVAGYDSTGERAALILIETGRPQPALIYISIPNTHAELYGIVDRIIAEIDVLAP